MTIDHIGFMIFPDLLYLRIIGRIAFPIFAFLTVQGYLYTSNLKNYITRLSIEAIISFVPFSLFIGNKPFYFEHQNVIFTLLLGVLAIYAIDKFIYNNKFIAIIILSLCCFTAYIIHSDYGVFGVLIIASFFIFNKNKNLSLISFAIINFCFSLLSGTYIQGFASLAVIPLYFYNHKLGKYKLKWLFYLFYPIHMIVIYFIAKFIL